MDLLPGGFPKTPEGVELKILKRLYTPEDAELFMKLKLEPESVREIGARLGCNEYDLSEKLEDMAQRGLIFRVHDDGKHKYKVEQFVVGIWEFQVNRLDLELTRLMDEYALYLGMTNVMVKTKAIHIIPVDKALDKIPFVETYNRMKDLVKDEDVIAVTPCMCAQMEISKGGACRGPAEKCLYFGDLAQYLIDNKMGRRINKDELMDLLKVAEESALVINASNNEKLSIVCLCRGCCCKELNGYKMLPRPIEMVNSHYQARIDTELCSACGICLERCQVDAIKEIADTMEVAMDRCIGCGLCVTTCPEEAISLIANTDTEPPFRDMDELKASILNDRKELGLV